MYLFFLEVSSRRVWLGGITRHPDAAWMQQVARNATMQETGYLSGCRYLLHDRDKKFCLGFRDTLATGGVECVTLSARSPESERPRGALGAIDQSRMSVQTDPIWGDFVAACGVGIPDPLSS